MKKFALLLVALFCVAALAQGQPDSQSAEQKAPAAVEAEGGELPIAEPESEMSPSTSSDDMAAEPAGAAASVAAPTPVSAPAPALAVSAQPGKLMIAVYMAGEEPQGARGVHSVLGGELARTISTSDRYAAVDRTEAILQQLSLEHVYQRSGAVDDEQIKALGQQFGVQYLCISYINPAGGKYYLDTRLVDVVTAEIMLSVTANSSLRDANEMTRAARSIALELIDPETARQQRQQKKKTLFYTAISLDVLGVGMVVYGLVENSNVAKLIDDEKYPKAKKAEWRRDIAYIAGGMLLASGITLHVLF